MIADATAAIRVTIEELFGAIAPILRFAAEADAITGADEAEYGLACYAYTRDLVQMFRLQNQLKYGLIGINEVLFVMPEIPFGGVKETGLGKDEHGTASTIA